MKMKFILYILDTSAENRKFLLQVTTERYWQSTTHRISQSIRDALLMLYPNFRYKPSRRIYFLIIKWSEKDLSYLFCSCFWCYIAYCFSVKFICCNLISLRGKTYTENILHLDCMGGLKNMVNFNLTIN